MAETNNLKCPLCTEILSAGGYVAEFAPRTGATCFRLYNKPLNSEIFRYPQSEKHRRANVYLFGNPILFPPNRIRGGRFVFNGKEYVFPLNEPQTGCSIHGDLLNLPFDCVLKTETEIVFKYSAKAGEYLGFPHDFSVLRHYKLGENGLEEFTVITNDGKTEMPVMLAYHTTLNLKFGGDQNDVRLEVPVAYEYLRDKNFLPTGEKAGGRPRDEELSNGTFKPANGAFSAFYKANESLLTSLFTNDKSGISLRYTCDKSFGYRMLYRGNGDDFAVTEPQTCAIDCFHLGEEPENLGLIVLNGGESKTFYTKIEELRSIGRT